MNFLKKYEVFVAFYVIIISDKLLKEEIYSNGNVKDILIFLFKYLFHNLHCCISGYRHKLYIVSQITTFVTVVYSVWCDGNSDRLMEKLLG
jgi:hypothetical protein